MSNTLIVTPGLSTWRHVTTLLRIVITKSSHKNIYITTHYGLCGGLDMSTGSNLGYWRRLRLQITAAVRYRIFLVLFRKYKVLHLSEYKTKDCAEQIDQFFKHLPRKISINELLKFEFRGIQFGRELLSSIQRNSFSNTLKEYSFVKASVERDLLINALELIYCYEQLFIRKEFESVFVNEVSYVNWGIPVKCAFKFNIEVHHTSYGYLGDQYYYIMRYQTNKDVYIPPGFEATNFDNPTTLKNSSIVNSVNTIGVWAHLCWDSAGVYGDQLYQSYNEWLNAVYNVSLERKDMLWIFKIHPHEVSSENNPRKESTNQANNTLTYLLDLVKPDDYHIKIDFNAEVKWEDIDAFTTVTGTIRYEAAAQGKTVVLSERSGKMSGGFSFYSKSKDEYLNNLRKIDNIFIGENEINKAKKYRRNYYSKNRYINITYAQSKKDLINLIFNGYIR